ncbi:MAG TPA: hypothetical protein PLZ36_00820 [Armatimonadota bacterium]|nr:hypothetical protein [Armatimonadota bacterium]
MIQYRLFTCAHRQLRALAGLSRQECDRLVLSFVAAYHGQGIVPLWRGRTGYLPTVQSRLAFILVYGRQYPTQDLQAALFG